MISMNRNPIYAFNHVMIQLTNQYETAVAKQKKELLNQKQAI